MKTDICVVSSVATTAFLIAIGSTTLSRAGEGGSPIFGVTIPEGYRHWELIAPSHEEGNFNELRGILGNDIAVKAYREGTLPFPDGAMFAKVA